MPIGKNPKPPFEAPRFLFLFLLLAFWQTVIPGRKNRKKAVVYDEEKYKKRPYIERVFGKIKENRCLVVRYEKSDINFLNFIMFAFIKILIC
jgi:hypothetical protein